MSTANPPDPDDFFADTRMSFGDHIEELRIHLFRAIYGFVIALFASFFIGGFVLEYITAPVKEQLRDYYKRRAYRITGQVGSDPKVTKLNEPTQFTGITFHGPQLKALLEGKSPQEINAFKRPLVRKPRPDPGQLSWLERLFSSDPAPSRSTTGDEVDASADDLVTLWVRYEEPVRVAADLLDSNRYVNQFDDPTTLNPMEAFMVYFKVCMLCALVIGSPWIFYQIWAFIAAGLYPHEKKLVHVYLPFSLGLFLAGVFLCEFVVLPRALEALLWFNEWLGLKPDMRLNEWLSFAIILPVVFGLSFQTPMVMVFLVKLGIMDVETFRSKRRIAWFLLAVIAAVITPTPDAITMALLWVPMSLLFELGIVLVARMAPREEFEDAPDQDEFVGA